MQSLYANLKAGMPKAEALRQAQLTLIRGQKESDSQVARSGGLAILPKGKSTPIATTFSDPFYWAPFILIGDWR
jgi:CHAT domain-containing protein